MPPVERPACIGRAVEVAGRIEDQAGVRIGAVTAREAREAVEVLQSPGSLPDGGRRKFEHPAFTMDPAVGCRAVEIAGRVGRVLRPDQRRAAVHRRRSGALPFAIPFGINSVGWKGDLRCLVGSATLHR